MTFHNRNASSLRLLFLLGMPSCLCAQGFVEDSNATLTFRNYYLDRDYKGTTPQNAAREWAQGFVLKASSGFTPGPVGFGLDALGMLGVKLDSSPDRAGTGLLPYSAQSHRAADDYSELGLTAKAKISKSELQFGNVSTFLPIAFASPNRLLPQTFRGIYLRSSEIDRLNLHVGYLDRINLRDSTDYQPMHVSSLNQRFNSRAESKKFVFAGGDYQWTPALKLKYFHARLDDIYEKDYVGFDHVLFVGAGSLKTDFRFFRTGEDGVAKAGPVDNRNSAVMFTYTQGAQSFGAGYMRLDGKTAMPYLAGTDPIVITEGLLGSEFLNPKERSWHLLYSYDFVGMGIPGLKGTVRYVKGDNVELPTLGGSGLTEEEFYTELSYALQAPFKGVGIRLRNSRYHNDFSSAASLRDANETRVQIEYTVKLW